MPSPSTLPQSWYQHFSGSRPENRHPPVTLGPLRTSGRNASARAYGQRAMGGPGGKGGGNESGGKGNSWWQQGYSSNSWARPAERPEGGYLASALAREQAKSGHLEAIIEKREREEAAKKSAATMGNGVVDAIATAFGFRKHNTEKESKKKKDRQELSQSFHFVRGMRRLLRSADAARKSQLQKNGQRASSSDSSSSSGRKKKKNNKKGKDI